MNRFHSSGTASGKVDVMWMWKMIIPIIASVPTNPPAVKNRISGSVNSTAVPAWAASAAWRDGRRSSGWSR